MLSSINIYFEHNPNGEKYPMNSKNKTQGSALFTLVSGVVIVAAVVGLLMKLASSGYYADVEATTKEATATRIMPTGQLVVGAPKDIAPAPAPAAATPAPAAASDASAPAAASDAASAPASGGSNGDAQVARGAEIFDKTCKACHGATSPIPGAPKVTKNDEWAPRIKQGEDTLVQHAINGFNAMPPKGGNTALSDDDIKATVHYMVKQSGG